MFGSETDDAPAGDRNRFLHALQFTDVKTLTLGVALGFHVPDSLPKLPSVKNLSVKFSWNSNANDKASFLVVLRASSTLTRPTRALTELPHLPSQAPTLLSQPRLP
jgi:hypothetical protein